MEISETKNEQKIRCSKQLESSFLIKQRKKDPLMKKKRKIEKNKDEKHIRIASFSIIHQNKFTYEMKLFGDLTITNEGQIRLFPAINHVSFGFHQVASEIVEYVYDIKCYNIKLKQNEQMPFCTVSQVLKMLNMINGKSNFQSIFEEFETRFLSFKQEMEQYHHLVDYDNEEKNQEIHEFTQFCFDYLKKNNGQESLQNYFSPSHFEIENSQENKIDINNQTEISCSKLNSNQLAMKHSSQLDSLHNQISPENKSENSTFESKMFTYSIGKINFETKDFDILYQGYSAGYLEFLGLDKQSLISLALRGKRIDLFKDKQDITNFSALMLHQFNQQNPDISEIASNIVTFDGFPIKIYQDLKRAEIPSQFQGPLKKPEYYMLISDIDVDIRDLENLMEYRQQLARQPNSLPLDTLISRELSYKFEDIEYSVHSEDFINKYYPNIEQKEDNFSQIKPCNYRLLKS